MYLKWGLIPSVGLGDDAEPASDSSSPARQPQPFLSPADAERLAATVGGSSPRRPTQKESNQRPFRGSRLGRQGPR